MVANADPTPIATGSSIRTPYAHDRMTAFCRFQPGRNNFAKGGGASQGGNPVRPDFGAIALDRVATDRLTGAPDLRAVAQEMVDAGRAA
jgi:hypothetical protein